MFYGFLQNLKTLGFPNQFSILIMWPSEWAALPMLPIRQCVCQIWPHNSRTCKQRKIKMYW